jgi:hypothetical protein
VFLELPLWADITLGRVKALMPLALALALLLSAPARAQEQPPPEPPPEEPLPVTWPDVEVLSKPGELSRYAFTLRKAIVRKSPDWEAKAIGRLRLKTQDGTDELLMVLDRSHDVSGRPWLRVRLPVLPNNTTGWVPEESLGRLRRTQAWLIVDRRRLRATLIRGGRTVFRARVGIGRSHWPTPRGEYYIRDRLSGFGNPVYGPLAFGLNARSSVLTDWPGGGFIGIHGTNEPYLIPGRISHGCIRMRNRDILRLDRLMPVGSPVSVR